MAGAKDFKKMVGGKVSEMSSPKKMFTGRPGGASPAAKGGCKSCGSVAKGKK
jgi:hypothetical protein